MSPHRHRLLQACAQYDAQAAIHRVSITGDWSELCDLSTGQLIWLQSFLSSPEITPRLAAELERRNVCPAQPHG